MMRVFLVDDEPLAIQRLSRLLSETNRVQIVGRKPTRESRSKN